MNSSFVSIIIPTYKDWDRLELCVRALERQSYPRAKFEVIVINNAPEDSPAKLKLESNFKLLTEPRFGSYAARNKGIELAKGELFGFTDSDCIPAKTWIERAVNFLSSNSEYQRVGGRIQLFGSGDKVNLAELYELQFAFPQRDFVNRKMFAATANMFAHQDVFENVGLFRADLVSGGDQEWGHRANREGFLVGYSDQIVVRHPTRNSIAQLAAKRRRVVSGKDQLAEQSGGSKLPLFLQFLYRLRSPLRRAWRLFFNRETLLLREKISLVVLEYYLRMVHETEWLRLSRENSKERASNR